MKGGRSLSLLVHLSFSFFSGVVIILLSVYRASSEACLEGQSEMESTQPLDDASMPSTSQEPTSSSAGTHHFMLDALFIKKKKSIGNVTVVGQ